MRTCQLLAAVLVLLSCARSGYGMSFEQLDRTRTAGTRDPAARFAGLFARSQRRREFLFQGHSGRDRRTGQALLRRFACEIMSLSSRIEKPEVRTFHGDKVDYNVNYHCAGGLSLYFARSKEEAETYEPTLTIFVDRGRRSSVLEEDRPARRHSLDQRGSQLPVERQSNQAQAQGLVCAGELRQLYAGSGFWRTARRLRSGKRTSRQASISARSTTKGTFMRLFPTRKSPI